MKAYPEAEYRKIIAAPGRKSLTALTLTTRAGLGLG